MDPHGFLILNNAEELIKFLHVIDQSPAKTTGTHKRSFLSQSFVQLLIRIAPKIKAEPSISLRQDQGDTAVSLENVLPPLNMVRPQLLLYRLLILRNELA